MIVIVDYGVGNVGSIKNMLKKAGSEALVSGQADDILAAHKLILPGVGAFGHCMQQLRESSLVEPLTQRVCVDGRPLLGICVGMQLLARGSEEGAAQGLGWIDANVKRFQFNSDDSRRLRVPHMGWNILNPQSGEPLLASQYAEQRFYFVHSYYMECDDISNVIGKAHYGFDFAAAVRNGNVYGVQFHPEKSHKYGMELLKNYAQLNTDTDS